MSPRIFPENYQTDDIHQSHNSYLWYCYTNYVNRSNAHNSPAKLIVLLGWAGRQAALLFQILLHNADDMAQLYTVMWWWYNIRSRDDDDDEDSKWDNSKSET